MKFTSPLLEGVLLRRHRRFLADVRLADGTLVTAHTANTGAMTGCARPGSRVWLQHSGKPQRKYPFTWVLVEVAPGVLAGIDTLRANHLVREAVTAGRIETLRGYPHLRAEAAYGAGKSRIDLLLEGAERPRCLVEVKNVTLVREGIAYFPDAVSARGSRQLRELVDRVRSGERAVVLFCIQRPDARELRPADDIDPAYGRALRGALKAGVEALAYDCHVDLQGIRLRRRLPVICPR